MPLTMVLFLPSGLCFVGTGEWVTILPFAFLFVGGFGVLVVLVLSLLLCKFKKIRATKLPTYNKRRRRALREVLLKFGTWKASIYNKDMMPIRHLCTAFGDNQTLNNTITTNTFGDHLPIADMKPSFNSSAACKERGWDFTPKMQCTMMVQWKTHMNCIPCCLVPPLCVAISTATSPCIWIVLLSVVMAICRVCTKRRGQGDFLCPWIVAISKSDPMDWWSWASMKWNQG